MSKMIKELENELHPSTTCKLCDILALLDDEDEKYFRGIVGSAPHAIIARVLTRNGHKISGASVARHIEKGHA